MVPLDGIGTLDKRIRIMKYSDIEDEYGLSKQTLVDAIGNAIWARIEPARGKAITEALKDKTIDVTKVTIRYRPNISANMLVKYKSHVYNIMSVVDPYEDHVKLELYCQLERRGENDD
jgi:SPP1 family predicted phage head-tail adaptor